MEISLLQGLLITLAVMVIALDNELEGFFIFRPIIVCPVVGAILGDLQIGLAAGALVELAFAGISPVGGVTPPDAVITSVMTVVLSKTANVDVTTAFAMAYPFGLLKQFVGTVTCTVFAFWNKLADAYAEKADLKGIYKICAISLCITTCIAGLITFLSVYAAQELLKLLIESMPEWLTNGLGVAGGLIPAIGFAMLLRVILKGRYVPYLLAGFLFASFVELNNILPVAIMGLAFALADYYKNNNKQVGGSENEGI